MILRGNAGVGKTTFALQAIEEINEIDNSFYFSTRVSDALLLTQFPWLAKKVYGEDIGDNVQAEMLRKQEEELVQEAAAKATSEDDNAEPKRPWFSRMKLVWGTGINLRMGQNLQQTRIELNLWRRSMRPWNGAAANGPWSYWTAWMPWRRPAGSTRLH